MSHRFPEVRSILSGSGEYRAAVELRHRVFFAPAGAGIGKVFDAVEAASLHFAILLEEVLVGYARLTIQDELAQISQMVVEPSFQARGIGSALMNGLLQRARQAGVTAIHLNARTSAIEFYGRFGFVAVGEPFPSAKTGLPHLRMELSKPPTLES